MTVLVWRELICLRARYEESAVCFAYLSDIDSSSPAYTCGTIVHSRWFSRGWTLQELLAPRNVLFFDRYWRLLGSKKDLSSMISERTGIDSHVIMKGEGIHDRSIAQRMSWAAGRVTTRPEDQAYCLLGILGVNMPMLYGEGTKAFIRLQEEIMKETDDHTIFAWSMASPCSGMLAPSPDSFRDCSSTRVRYPTQGAQPFQMTNRGLAISLEITPWAADTYLAFLNSDSSSHDGKGFRLGIFLRRCDEDDQYARVDLDGTGGLFLDREGVHSACCKEYCPRPKQTRKVFVRNRSSYDQGSAPMGGPGFLVPSAWLGRAFNAGSDNTPVKRKIRPEKPLQLMVLDIHGYNRFTQIALGFDFDFNPICLLAENIDGEASGSPHAKIWETSSCDISHFDPEEQGRVIRRVDHDEIWRLKGHRCRGLDVVLSRVIGGNGPLLKLHRNEDSWDIFLEDC